MLNMEQFKAADRDNTIVVNGVEFKATDAIAEAIMEMLVSGKVSTTKASEAFSYKDTDPKWEISKQGRTYIIQSKIYSKQRAAKAVANNYIKALPGIKTIDIPFVGDKAGQSWKAWGFSKKDEAEKALKSLPTVLKAEELNEMSEKLRKRG